MLAPGTLLQNRYRIKAELARGGMGAVYEAEAVHLGHAQVAVKETFFSQPFLREQFEREASTLARLRHSALPKVTDHFSEGAGQFLVMEFIPGEDLLALLDKQLKTHGAPFPWAQVCLWADKLLDALDYIHNQYPPVIHRDIKPQNLKLTPQGEIVLLDFGLAKDGTTPTRPGGSVRGYTPDYAPPEQMKFTGTDARSDLFSLGATLYHLMTGRPPVSAKTREEVMEHKVPDPLRPAHQQQPEIPFAIAAVLARSLALEGEKRYASATAMREAFEQARQQAETVIAEGRRERERQETEHKRQELERALAEQRRLEAERQQAERQRQEAIRLEAERQEAKRQQQEAARLEAERREARRQEVERQRQLEAEKQEAEQQRQENVKDESKPSPFAVRWLQAGKALLGYHQATAPNIEMVLVKGGSFLMGSPANEEGGQDEEGPQHRVTVPSFYMGKYEITQAQWRAVMETNPSRFKGDDLPVGHVSWNDAKAFCRKLSQLTGKQYRLPTEAEWEYAARAGTTGPYAGQLEALAWYSGNAGSKTHPVGQKSPNAFGLYDMHGNVWEWCEDTWHKNYEGAPTDGSSWLSGGDSSLRVVRGGSWYFDAVFCRSACRCYNHPADVNVNLGFRVVISARTS